MLRRGGGPDGANESDQLSGGCRFPQDAAPQGYGKGKVLYLLTFMAMIRLCSFFNQPWLNQGLSLATLSPDSFSGPFWSCCRLTHIKGVPGPRAFVFLTCVV